MEQKTLTPELAAALEHLPDKRRNAVQELRLRQGGPVKAVFPWGEELLTAGGRAIPVTETLLRELLDRATGCSPYTLRQEEAELFLPLEGGGRMGLCGEAVVREGRLRGLRHISSMAIRFARQYPGVAAEAARVLTAHGDVRSALIVSPPGRGKTTFLRDLVRLVSERGWRVSVADERRELAAAHQGVPQLDLGPCTDVLTGCPKAQAMGLLIRTMNPQVLAVDELASQAEVDMALEAASCGVRLFATAHGDGLSTMRRRPGYRELLESGAFDWCITLKGFGTVQMERLGSNAEDRGSLFGGGGVYDGRLGGTPGNAAAASAAETASAGPGADAGGNGAAYAAGGGAV